MFFDDEDTSVPTDGGTADEGSEEGDTASDSGEQM